MAGSYPDYPEHRLAYEIMGLRHFRGVAVTAPVEYDPAVHLAPWNKEIAGGAPYVNDGFWHWFLFPCLMDIHTMSVWGATDLVTNVNTSVDSTDGVDGTWTSRTFTPATASVGPFNPYWRTLNGGGSWGGIKWLRFNAFDHDFRMVHLFGKPTAGELPDRLEVWHPTLNQRIGPADLDWGNAARSSSADKTFRVKNLSATYTANTITVGMEATTDPSPTMTGQHTISNDGTNFFSSRTITSLAPGAISAVHTLRRVTPSNAQLSTWALRMYARAASWT